MPRIRFIAQVNVVDGRDDEFNEWHTNVHMPEVLAASGFTSAQRFRLVTPDAADPKPFRYLIIYEGECDDPKKALDGLWKGVAEGKVGMSDTLAGTWMALYEEIPGARTPK